VPGFFICAPKVGKQRSNMTFQRGNNKNWTITEDFGLN